MMHEIIHEYLSEETINARILEMAGAISRDYEGQEIRLLCVLKGASFFACELAKRITVPVTMDFISVSSYGNGTKSTGQINIKRAPDSPVAGQDVLVVEDIIDSGRTLDALKPLLEEKGAKSVRLCTLLDKPDRREVEVAVDYSGFSIPDEFVVGYGLDYAQRFRNLPYIGILEFQEENS